MTRRRKGQEAGTGDFASDYAEALRLHAAQPGEAGLSAAYELGHQALDRGFSMLELVAMHLELRRAIVQEVGIAPLRDLDAFLSEALAAFEITQQGYVESHRAAAAERDRAEWLGGLSEAYLAIAAAATLKERLEQVCIQAQRFLNAADAHLVLGRTAPADPTPGGGDVMSALLHGGVGCLSVTAPPGRRWDEQDRTTLQQLAVLISAPIDDARRLEMAHSSGQLGALLGGVADPEAVLSSFVGAGVEAIGARRAFVHFLDGDGGAGEAATMADAVARSGEPAFNSGRGEEPGLAILPLGSAAARLGAVILEFDDGQPFDEVQRAFLIDVSDRLTAALERSRAYARERRAREAAETASRRLAHLQGLAGDLARAATRRRVAQVLVRRAVTSTTALGGIVAAYTRGPQLDVLAAHGELSPARLGALDGVLDALEAAPTVEADSGLPIVAISDLPTDLERASPR